MENEHKVSGWPLGELLGTRRAAEFLDVPEPYLIGLIEDGAIPFTTAAGRRRIEAKDLIEYKRVRNGERAAALENMARFDADFGLL